MAPVAVMFGIVTVIVLCTLPPPVIGVNITGCEAIVGAGALS